MTGLYFIVYVSTAYINVRLLCVIVLCFRYVRSSLTNLLLFLRLTLHSNTTVEIKVAYFSIQTRDLEKVCTHNLQPTLP